MQSRRVCDAGRLPVAPSLCTCCRHYPGAADGRSPRSKITQPCQPSPIPLSGRPAHRPFRGLLGVYSRCGLHTRAVTKFVTAIRGLQTFRHLHACPGCFRLERSPGGACTRWKSAALSRRTWIQDIRKLDDPWWKQRCTPLRRVDPLGRPHARAATRGMTFSILSSQLQSENSDTLLLALPTAQEH